MSKFILGQKVQIKGNALGDNAIGVIASVNTGSYSIQGGVVPASYCVATQGGLFSYTDDQLEAHREKPIKFFEFKEPSFGVGQRVFYSDYTHSPPLGVVTCSDWSDDNNQEYVTVRWDNEVISAHDPKELRDVEGTIRALSQPVP